ncbi:SagB/ThcOx family dehydrogenase [Persephonella sp.]
MKKIKLPEVYLFGRMPVEKALLNRRSHRSYREDPITIDELAQLLWAGNGVTKIEGFRTAPSAGALYPIVLYVLNIKIKSLDQGVYKYDPIRHLLIEIKKGDYSSQLCLSALNQESILNGSVNIIISADFSKTVSKYGNRGYRYVYMEAGHVSQNIYLQATALGLGTVSIGAFYDNTVKEILNMEEDPLYIMPVGKIGLYQ